MKRVLLIFLAVALVVALGLAALFYMRGQRPPAAADVEAIERLDQDVRMTAVMHDLRTAAGEGRYAIVNVNLVDPEAGAVVWAQTVITNGEGIEWVGPAAQAPPLAGATVIDGAGRYLSPGLTDMHVHTEHMSQHMLRLAAGVTGVRDMDGFPWLLRTRDAINSGAMIGATTYVSGTIIADQPLYGYAVVVSTPEEARQVVRDQAQCGYSFVKVHNSLAEPLFDAVADEAQRVNLDLVGHVPHDISLAHAIQSGHMRTIEHLKGFLIDQTLLPSDEAYAPALVDAEVWLTPTLYTRLGRAHGAIVEALMADPRQRYAPRARRESWQESIPAEESQDAQLYDRFVETQRIVMSRLLPLHPRWLVGTDAAGYAFNLAGFAMHDEMDLLHAAGLSSAETIRAATTAAAQAMRIPHEFGRIALEQRADFVLLANNPIADIGAYRSNLGVMARGRWYIRARLDAALDAIAGIYAEPALQLTPEGAQSLADNAAAAVAAGYVLEDSAVTAAADAMITLGHPAAAQRLRALAPPAEGVCAAETPN